MTYLSRYAIMSGMETKLIYPSPDGPWGITLQWQEVDGRLEVTSVTIASRTGTQPITTSDVRSIPLAGLITTARRQAVDRLRHEQAKAIHGAETAKTKAAAGYLAVAAGLIDHQIERVAAKRRRLDRTHFEKVALVYTDAYERGNPPTKTVAETFGVSEPTAAKWVARARHEHGLLSPTLKGKAGI